jgi:hypothetical protein
MVTDNYKTDLGALVKKYDLTLAELESQIAETKRKKSLVLQTIELSEKEGIFSQDKLFDVPSTPIRTTPIRISDKYAESTLPEAIFDALGNNKDGLDTEEIYAELLRHGFKSKAKNFKSDLYTRLYRLSQNERLISFKEGGLKKYKLPNGGDQKE